MGGCSQRVHNDFPVGQDHEELGKSLGEAGCAGRPRASSHGSSCSGNAAPAPGAALWERPRGSSAGTAKPPELLPCPGSFRLLPALVEMPNEVPAAGGEGVFLGITAELWLQVLPRCRRRLPDIGLEQSRFSGREYSSRIPSCVDRNSLMVDQSEELGLPLLFSSGPVSAGALWAAWLGQLGQLPGLWWLPGAPSSPTGSGLLLSLLRGWMEAPGDSVFCSIRACLGLSFPDSPGWDAAAAASSCIPLFLRPGLGLEALSPHLSLSSGREMRVLMAVSPPHLLRGTLGKLSLLQGSLGRGRPCPRDTDPWMCLEEGNLMMETVLGRDSPLCREVSVGWQRAAGGGFWMGELGESFSRGHRGFPAPPFPGPKFPIISQDSRV